LRQYTRDLLLAGADVINIYTTSSVFSGGSGIPAPQFTPEEIEAVVYEARAAGKRIMAHVDGGVGVRNAILAGVDSVDHPFYLSDEDAALLAEKGTFLVPTLACSYGIWNTAKQNPGAGIHAHAAARAEKIITDHVDGFGRAVAAGVKIAMGSDSFGLFQGDNLFELELMVQAGLTPMEAIVAATKSGAELLGLDQTLGTVTPGKIADLLVVTGNPLDDITLLRDRQNLDLIMKNGEIFKNQLAEQSPDSVGP
jgi:imidazolonepropionase-like amidohydrolase